MFHENEACALIGILQGQRIPHLSQGVLEPAQATHFLAQTFHFVTEIEHQFDGHQAHAERVSQAFDLPKRPDAFVIKILAANIRICGWRYQAESEINGN